MLWTGKYTGFCATYKNFSVLCIKIFPDRKEAASKQNNETAGLVIRKSEHADFSVSAFILILSGKSERIDLKKDFTLSAFQLQISVYRQLFPPGGRWRSWRKPSDSRLRPLSTSRELFL